MKTVLLLEIRLISNKTKSPVEQRLVIIKKTYMEYFISVCISIFYIFKDPSVRIKLENNFRENQLNVGLNGVYK